MFCNNPNAQSGLIEKIEKVEYIGNLYEYRVTAHLATPDEPCKKRKAASTMIKFDSPLLPVVGDLVSYVPKALGAVDFCGLQYSEKDVRQLSDCKVDWTRILHPDSEHNHQLILYDKFRREQFRMLFLKAGSKPLDCQTKTERGKKIETPLIYAITPAKLMKIAHSSFEFFKEWNACRHDFDEHTKLGLFIRQFMCGLGIRNGMRFYHNKLYEAGVNDLYRSPFAILRIARNKAQMPIALRYIDRIHMSDSPKLREQARKEMAVSMNAVALTVLDNHVCIPDEKAVEMISARTASLRIDINSFQDAEKKDCTKMNMVRVFIFDAQYLFFEFFVLQVNLQISLSKEDVSVIWPAVRDRTHRLSRNHWYIPEFLHMECQTMALLRQPRSLCFEVTDKANDQNKNSVATRNVCDMLAYAKLNPTQIEAVWNMLRSGVSLLTGLPGTGKSYTLACFIAVLMRFTSIHVAVVAPSGMASVVGKRNMELIAQLAGEEEKELERRLEFSTVHSFIYRQKYAGCFQPHLVIVDEAGMIDLRLCFSLLNQWHGQIIFTGDTNQLKPIGAGAVFASMVDSEVFPRVHLDQIMRTSSLGLLENIKHFHHTAFKNRDSSFEVLHPARFEKLEIAQTILDVLDKRMPDWRTRPFDFLLTTFTNENINSLTPYLRSSFLGVESVLGHKEFFVGDRVICTRNTRVQEVMSDSLYISRLTSSYVLRPLPI